MFVIMAAVDKETEVASPEKRQRIIRKIFGKKEKFPVVEVPEIPPEIEKAQSVSGASTQLQKPVVDDQGQIIVDAPGDRGKKITLPLTKEGVRVGLTYKIVDSLRWLAEWCLRLAKRAGIFINLKKKKGQKKKQSDQTSDSQTQNQDDQDEDANVD
ncbi:hypothetical protein ACFLZP_04135 [Patescibacteria group bacterium]